MYTLAKTFAKRNGAKAYWEEVNAAGIRLIDLFSTYQDLRVELHESFSNEQQYLNLTTLKSELHDLTVTLPEWLVGIGNRNLRATPGTLTLKVSKMYCHDVLSVDFLPRGGNTNYHPSNAIPLDEKTDILLTRDNTNYDNIGKHCLFTVGGFVHRHEYGVTGVYIVGGNETTKRSNSQEIGMLDFSRIGELEIQPIHAEQLVPPSTMLPYNESVYAKLPRKVEPGETVALVFGGYLHLLDNTYSIMSDTTAKINIQQLALIPRFFRSRLFLDLSSLESTLQDDPMTDLRPQTLKTTEAITAWLTHENSFWVYIKADSLQVKNAPLPRPCTPGRYFLGEAPSGALRVDYGELPAFIQTYEKPIWLLSAMWEQRTNTLFETTYFKDNRMKVLNDTPYLYRTHDQSLATLWQVERTELVATPLNEK